MARAHRIERRKFMRTLQRQALRAAEGVATVDGIRSTYTLPLNSTL